MGTIYIYVASCTALYQFVPTIKKFGTVFASVVLKASDPIRFCTSRPPDSHRMLRNLNLKTTTFLKPYTELV